MIRLARRTLRPLLILGLLLVLFFFGKTTLALAQISETEPAADKSYSIPYLIVILSVALGLILVLRPSLRHKEVQEKRKAL